MKADEGLIDQYTHNPAIRTALRLICIDGCTLPYIVRYQQHAVRCDVDSLTEWKRGYGKYKELQAKIDSALTTIRTKGLNISNEELTLLKESRTKEQFESVWSLCRQPPVKARLNNKQIAGLESVVDALWSGGCHTDMNRGYIQLKSTVSKSEYWKLVSGLISRRVGTNIDVRSFYRGLVMSQGRMRVKVKTNLGKLSATEQATITTYDGLNKRIDQIEHHQVLAIERLNKRKLVTVSVASVNKKDGETLKQTREKFMRYMIREIMVLCGIRRSACKHISKYLAETCGVCISRTLKPSIDMDIRKQLYRDAKAYAGKCYAKNIRHLLLEPPLNPGGRPLIGKSVLAIDPGFSNGCKVAVLDIWGAVLHSDVVDINSRKSDTSAAADKLQGLLDEYGVVVIALGDGTASSETERFLREEVLVGECEHVVIRLVSEAGVSVYSVSAAAKAEFGDTSPLAIGAISIGRRLIDPLSELVKVPPQYMGVGMYQHDLESADMNQYLREVVEGVVSDMGVNVNVASVYLLQYVAGLNMKLAENIYKYVNDEGPLLNRSQLMNVSGIGPKTYEQCVGFLRIETSEETLDSTCVHPKDYDIARFLLDRLGSGQPCNDVLDEDICRDACGKFGRDAEEISNIYKYLRRPSDPRNSRNRSKIINRKLTTSEIRKGDQIKGVVTNVTSFGAFVNVGAASDGLLHRSQFKGVHMVVGCVLDVVVCDVDLDSSRISLALNDEAEVQFNYKSPNIDGKNGCSMKKKESNFMFKKFFKVMLNL